MIPMSKKQILLIGGAVLALLIAVVLLCSRCSAQTPDESVPSTDDTSIGTSIDTTAGAPTVGTTESGATTTVPEEDTKETDIGSTGVADIPETTEPSDATSPETQPTQESTSNAETQPPATTTPTESTTSEREYLSYEVFINLSGEEQKEYRNTFDSLSDFFAWYDAAKAEYDAENPDVEIGDGPIDLGGNNG